MKIHWKRILKIFLFVLAVWLVFQIGFFTGERQSPNAYNRERLDKTEQAYINCVEKLKTYDLNF